MRFLNTRTLRFEQVPDSELHLEKNQYAILSHRWGADEDEVSFEDVQLSADFSNKKGCNKIKEFCTVASSANCRYGWVDTCCINKGNSSELSEAINSMYRWYQGSKICIAYLEDVPQKQLTDSAWFDRGWTLQELIGPKAVTFFDYGWNTIGTKTELIAELSRKTRIPERILNHTTELSTCSVAQRMSWAANRVTTREEDRAYSLMGLFNVNMPMIYGEREKAFLRLQQHIIQKSKDESIFAWATEFPGNTKTFFGIFAPSPLAYASCSNIVQTHGSHGFSESNGELSMRLGILPHSPETQCAILNCTDRAYPDSKAFILIGRASTKGEYVRVMDPKHVSRRLIEYELWNQLQKRQIRVLEDPIDPPVTNFFGFWFHNVPSSDDGESRTTMLSNSPVSETDRIRQHECYQAITGIVNIESRSSASNFWGAGNRWITFGFDQDLNPVLWGTRADNDYNNRSLRKMFRDAMASGPQSSEHQYIMKFFNTIVKEYRGERQYHSMSGKWPEASVETVDRGKDPQGRIIEMLDLKISIHLQPHQNPITNLTGNIEDDGSSRNPMHIWAVDIADMPPRKDSKEKSWHRLFSVTRKEPV